MNENERGEWMKWIKECTGGKKKPGASNDEDETEARVRRRLALMLVELRDDETLEDEVEEEEEFVGVFWGVVVWWTDARKERRDDVLGELLGLLTYKYEETRGENWRRESTITVAIFQDYFLWLKNTTDRTSKSSKVN